MTEKEAIEAIKSNYPDSGYTILREALDMGMDALADQMLMKEKGFVPAPAWIYEEIPNNGFYDFEKIEKALGFRLFFWQKTYMIFGEERRTGKTTAKELKYLLEFPPTPRRLFRAASIAEDTWNHEVIKMREKLVDAGIECPEIVLK